MALSRTHAVGRGSEQDFSELRGPDNDLVVTHGTKLHPQYDFLARDVTAAHLPEAFPPLSPEHLEVAHHPTPGTIEHATALRVLAAAGLFLEDAPAAGDDVLHEASLCLGRLIQRLIRTGDPALAWLLLASVAGAYPLAEDVRALCRSAQLGSEREVMFELLQRRDLLPPR